MTDITHQPKNSPRPPDTVTTPSVADAPLPTSRVGRRATQAQQLQRTMGNRAMLRVLRHDTPQIGSAPASTLQRDYEKTGSRGGVYESEAFAGGKRERPTYAEIPVHITDTKDRGAAPIPLSQYADGGNVDDESATRKAGYDGGHIVGLQIGGDDIPENVVPMFKAFNRGIYKRMEDAVRKKAEEMKGTQLWITVHCYYDQATDDIPYAFDIMLESVGKNDARTVIYTEFLRQPDDIKTVDPLNEDSQKIVRGEVGASEVKEAASKNLESSANMFDLNGEESMAAYIKKYNHLPRSKQGIYPDSPSLRPYEYLDLLAFAGKLGGPNFGSFREFSADQRTIILQANMARNGGALKTDDPINDPVTDGILSEKGDVNFPEIDHIVPKSSGGSNFYSNARVVSWQLNNREDRVKSLFGIVDMSKKALPPMQNMGKQGIAILIQSYLTRIAQPNVLFSHYDIWKWGTETFSIMSGAKLTNGRLSLVKTNLQDYIKQGVLAAEGEKYKRIK
jgi:hypothetical protein